MTKIVFDSLRYASDLPILAAAGFRTWRIECPMDECMRRLAARGQIVNETDWTHASEMELSAINFDVVLINHGRPQAQLEEEIDLLLRS